MHLGLNIKNVSKGDSIAEEAVYRNELSLLLLFQEEMDCSDFLQCLFVMLVVGFLELYNIAYKELVTVGYYSKSR